MSSTVYVKLTSAASGSQWNPIFPTPGQNNSSKGFYGNWDAIDSAFQETANELTSLQNLVLSFSGDASGTSPSFGSAPIIAGVPTLNVPVNLSQTGVVAGSYDTSNGNLKITVDAQGRLHFASITPKTITGYVANTALAPNGQIGTGTGTISFPTVTFDSAGQLSAAGNVDIKYGLLSQTLSTNALLVGGANNISQELASPGDNNSYVLSYQGGSLVWTAKDNGLPAFPGDGQTYVLQETNGVVTWAVPTQTKELPASPTDQNTYVLQIHNNALTWVPATTNNGTLTGLTSGQGISVNNINPNAPTVGINFISNANQITTAADTDIMAFQSNGTLGYITVAHARTVLSRLNADPFPQLANVMDVGPYPIQSSQTGIGVLIRSSNSNTPKASLRVSDTSGLTLATSGVALTLNGAQWPANLGSAGQYLSLNSSNALVWTTLPTAAAFNQTVSNTIFVGPDGDDTNGVGSLNNPYLTIAKAVSQLNKTTSDIQTVMLLGGTYVEDVTISSVTNVSLEGFFASTPSIVKGSLGLGFGISSFYMSNVRVTRADKPNTDTIPVFSILSDIGSVQVKDCQLLRGDTDDLSALPVIQVQGTNTYDISFTNTMIQGTIVNAAQSSNGSRVVINNAILPPMGYVGLQTTSGTNTYLNGVPLVRGVQHSGGILTMSNLDAVRPQTYTVFVDQPDVILWSSDGSQPLFVDNQGNNVEEDPSNPGHGLASSNTNDGVSYPLQVNKDGSGITQETYLLDVNNQPIPDPAHAGEQPTVYLTTIYVQATDTPPAIQEDLDVGIYSTADLIQDDASSNVLALTNVNLYYQGQFSKLYKSGSCDWTFTRVRRRADQDLVNGARIAYDVMPDAGQFLARYVANGGNLTLEAGGAGVPGGYIDPGSGNTFHVTLQNTSTIKLHTPSPTDYTGEMYSELLIAVLQSGNGNFGCNFSTDGATNIIWLGASDPNPTAGGYTFYTFRYLSSTQKWIGQKQEDGSTRKIEAVTTTSDYTLKSSDVGAYVRRYGTTANNVIVPSNANSGYAIGTQIDIVQTGRGQVSVIPQSGTGVVINTPYGYALRAQFSRATITKVATDAWDLSGDLDTTQTVAAQTTADTTGLTADSNKTTADGKTSS